MLVMIVLLVVGDDICRDQVMKTTLISSIVAVGALRIRKLLCVYWRREQRKMTNFVFEKQACNKFEYFHVMLVKINKFTLNSPSAIPALSKMRYGTNGSKELAVFANGCNPLTIAAVTSPDLASILKSLLL